MTPTIVEIRRISAQPKLDKPLVTPERRRLARGPTPDVM
jgi:hypothetical protein